MNLPETLIGAVRYFADLNVCNQYMRKIKWPDGKVSCPACESENIGEIKSRNMLQCKCCRKQFSYKVGTIFEDSPLGLDKWFVAVWCIANMKNGISSHELGRAIGVTQKTAWFMLHRIRKAMETGTFKKMDGPSEADTTYVGGKAANMHKDVKAKRITGRGAVDKTAIHGVLQRGNKDAHSTVTASVINSESAEKVMAEVRRSVRYGARVFTDEAPVYGDLALTHVHRAIDHSKCYAIGEIHTNGIENFWSLLKRTLAGTYVAVAPFHLFRYVTEQIFRFNNRKTSDRGRFALVMARCAGRRITWRQLCGIGDSGFMGIS